MKQIKIYCEDWSNIPRSKKGGWFDIPLDGDLYYEKGDIVKIVLDLRMEMPEGYEAIIQPRSSTLEKTGLISSGFGVIEDSYCGIDDYIGYRFYATKTGLVSKGSCLVQMRFQEKMKDYQLIKSSLDEFIKNKNRGGFGSTDNEDGKYSEGFYDGFDEGSLDGYEQGFRDGYDRCIEDLKLKFNEQKV